MHRLFLATALLASAGAARADFAADFKACAALDNGAERLGCYDGLARRMTETVSTARPAESAAPDVAATPAVPAAPAAVPAVSQEQRFGLETIQRKPEAVSEAERDAERIRTRYVGEFKGWEPKTHFKLENGQVWKNVGSDSVVYPAGTNPAVTIEKGVFGSYWLSVEGLNRKARVKRVK